MIWDRFRGPERTRPDEGGQAAIYRALRVTCRDQRYRLSLRALRVHRGNLSSHLASAQLQAASFAVMPRWCFIGIAIFHEVVALKSGITRSPSVRHSRGGLVLGKHIGWFTCPLLVGVGLAHKVLAHLFSNQHIFSVTKGTAGDYSLLVP